MDAAPGVTRGSAEEVRVSGRRANGVQASCITAAPRPCRLCRSHDAVQAQHAALGERASPIAVRLTTSPSRGSFEQVRSVSRQGNSAAGQGLAGDRSRGALALSSPIKGGEP